MALCCGYQSVMNRKEERKKGEQNQYSHVSLSQFCMIVMILPVFYGTLLWLSKSCSQSLRTGSHVEPAPSIHIKYYLIVINHWIERERESLCTKNTCGQHPIHNKNIPVHVYQT